MAGCEGGIAVPTTPHHGISRPQNLDKFGYFGTFLRILFSQTAWYNQVLEKIVKMLAIQIEL
jgi:hypothetical protein